MGVHVARGDGDALGQAGPPGRAGAQCADAGAERGQRVFQAGGGEVGEAGVQPGEEVGGRVAAVLVDALVAGGAGVAGLGAGQLPDDPVGRLDPAGAGRVDAGVLLQHLEGLRELPLGGDPASVAADPRFAALVGEGVDAVGLVLGGMVLPQLGPGVRPVGPLGQQGERRAVGAGRQDGAGGEVGADADDVGGVHARVGERGRDGGTQHVAPVLGVLQRPVGGQRCAGGRQTVLDDGVPVLMDGRAQFGAVADPDDDGAPGQGAEVDADRACLGRVRIEGDGTGVSGHGAVFLVRAEGEAYTRQ